MQVDGYSLDAQRDKLRKYAAYEDMVIAGEYSDEGFSGKNIQGRQDFQRMLNDIQDCKDGVSYVLVFKLSRFGRNAADVLNSLQLMQDFGVNLICVEDGIDSSKDAGKLMISVLSAVAEIERENIRTQTMAGREQKAREGKWNGGFAPYGYSLENGDLVIAEDEVEVIRVIYDRYIHTNEGVAGVAKYLNRNGFVKKLRQNNTIPGFSRSFVQDVLDNPVYMGKIAYGRRRTEKKQGTRNEMHVVEQSEFPIYDGQHEAIISEEDWYLAQEKRKINSFKREKVNNPDHAHILSGILKCPCCGKSMYGNIAKAHSKDKKTRYYYYCKNTVTPTGHECSFRLNIEQTEINKFVAKIISAMVNNPRFVEAIQAKIGSAVDTEDMEKQIAVLQGQLKQAFGTKSRLERQMDTLDINDAHYDRKILDLQRRYDEQYDTIEEIEVQIGELQGQIRSIQQEKISGDNIYRLLLAFDEVYHSATEAEQKEFMKAFIERIEMFPEKRKDGSWIKKIVFNFPVPVDGEEVKELPLETETTVETVVVKPTAEQQRIVESLSERAAKVHAGSVDPHVDNMLKITSDGRKLGLDQRLINPLLPDDPGSKVNTCVANIYRIWDEGQEQRLTQLVFCDLSTPKSAGSEHTGEFSVYDDIRAKLIARGVPPEQIAFIHDANTEIKKKELFARVRSGDVRVLIGSTAKMGAGTNCQDRLIAIHDCDCPWRPGDLEQRSGRIIRQGNMNPDVHIYRYVTEGTFDSYLWQTIECKQRFISQIMTSKSPVRACDDVDEAVLSYAEIKALCAGDPRIKEKMDLDVDVARLRLMKADHKSKQYKLEDQLLRYFPAALKTQQGYEEGFLHDLDTLAAHPVPEKDFVGIEIRGVSYTDKEAAGKALIACMKDAAKGDAIPVGHYRGLELQMFYDTFGKEFKLTMQGAMTHTVTLGSDPKGNLLRMENGLATIPARLEVVRSEIDNLHRQQEAAQTEVKKPFPQEEELKIKSSRLAELDAALNIGNAATPSEPAEDRIAKQTRPACLPSNPHHRSVQTKKTRQEVR